MEFRYRYVKYGTAFEKADGPRLEPPRGSTPAEVDLDSRRLHPNELVVDVGGECLGFGQTRLPIFDHHFHRDKGQFPSAAAAVLHHARQIFGLFAGVKGPIWLVTHQQPDFDAYSAMYLARGILQGHDAGAAWSIPHDGWQAFGIQEAGWRANNGNGREIDWFHPFTTEMPDERRWPVLLAAFASLVDNCRGAACPKNRTLDAVLYAALIRGREYGNSGAVEFFDAVRQRLADGTRGTPFFDSVLEGHPLFAPELALLDREVLAYQSDLRRARRCVVYMRRSNRLFREWYGEVAQQPLLADDLSLNPAQALAGGEELTAVDGLFLRDPECLLFKDWARQDREHSSLGGGFTFTAIANTGERPAAQRNTSNYYFSLDPERAITEGLHLYNVWAALEARELKTLLQDEKLSGLRAQNLAVGSDGQPAVRCRTGFEQRAAQHGPLCDDPWFDGNNYACTIIPTPNRGTVIGAPGSADDLSDDPIARLVAEVVESPALPGEVTVADLSLTGPSPPDRQFASIQSATAQLEPVPPAHYRVARLSLAASVDPTKGKTGEQIGRWLWKLLDPSRPGVPDDFTSRHLLLSADSVEVWSRAGIVIAAKPTHAGQAKEVEGQFRKLVELASSVGQLATRNPTKATDIEAAVAEGHKLSREITLWRRQLSYPESRLLRRFFEAANLAEVLESVHDTNNSLAASLLGRRLDANVGYLASVQNAAEWLEMFIVSYYSLELAHMLAGTLSFNALMSSYGVLAVAALTALTLALGMQPWADHGPAEVSSSESHHPQGSHGAGRLSRSLVIVLFIITVFVIAGIATKKPGDAQDPRSPPANAGHAGGHAN